MKSINALSLVSAGNEWLANTPQPRILHIFDHACNLINANREVLSIVTPPIGDGPFNIVIDEEIHFSDHLRVESPVLISPAELILGDLTICCRQPCPADC